MALKYAKNALAAVAPPRTTLGELTTLPRTPSRLGMGTPPDALGASILAPAAHAHFSTQAYHFKFLKNVPAPMST